jgi:hypothetical protein
MFTGNPGRVLLGELIQQLPKENFHEHEIDPHNIANVRDPTKFKH